jgi:hypothetical protein
MTRRQFVSGVASAPLLAASWAQSSDVNAPIQLRGYYFTLCRMPHFGYAEWTGFIDKLVSDGANMVILWVAGAFRSKRFPITWQYNLDHTNVQEDFVKRLIDYAHSKQVKVLLGFTPFSYDGVNQYTLEHPELKSVQENGKLAKLSGMHCWGYGLNPSRPEAQKFMLEYASEMFFDFYPNADGLLIESSDYAICYCPQCQGHYYEREFQFVKAISEEVWKAKPDATILVYPHYFDGGSVPGFQVNGAQLQFDKRWTLFFTPHSAHFNQKLLDMCSGNAVYWDSNPVFKGPRDIQEGAQIAVQHKMRGYMPSLETYTFLVKYPESDEAFLEGHRLKPFGFGWLQDGKDPYGELPIRINRIAYRKFTRNPTLSFEDFRAQLAIELWGNNASPAPLDDVFFLQDCFFKDRSWFSPNPMVTPELFAAKLEMGVISLAQITDYRSSLARLRQMDTQYKDGPLAYREIGEIAAWIVDKWTDKETLLVASLR